ncbi:MAG: DUF4342 domain-containing protein [Clostridiales bacterium]|nr:DUF4342 domain-containing protein [Clostridiales bacterium]
MNELEKLDALKLRMNVTYGQAKEALDKCEWDLASALVYLEEQGFSSTLDFDWGEELDEEDHEPIWDKEKTDHFVRGIVEQVKAYIKEGNVTKIRLINGEKTLIEIPATIGVLGVGVMLFSLPLALAAAIGATAAMAQEMVFEVEKADGTVDRRELKFPRFYGKGGGKDDACCEDCDCDCEEEGCDECGSEGDEVAGEEDTNEPGSGAASAADEPKA